MLKGVKYLGNQKGCDNSGDGIYELKGKSKADAKKHMHRTTRTRLKNELKQYTL